MQPIGAVVFALDGILIGAGDSRYLALAMVAAAACFAPLLLAALVLDWGVVGVWAALNVLMFARLVGLGRRFASGRWAVVGATA
jgi:Na+-driven multidrug efflux pump